MRWKAKVASSLADVWQKLFEQQDITAPFTFTPGCMKTTPVQTLTETDTQERVYQKPVMDVNELKQHLIEIWSATSRASFTKQLISGYTYCVSKPKANRTFATIFLLNCHDFKAYVTAVMNKLTYVSFHKVG